MQLNAEVRFSEKNVSHEVGGLFTLMKKKLSIVAKILVTCQNFGRISYVVIKN